MVHDGKWVGPVEVVDGGGGKPFSLDEWTFRGGGVLSEATELNREHIIPHCLEAMRGAGWLDNFGAVTSGEVADRRVGRVFTDSEAYKLAEAMAWDGSSIGMPAWADELETLAALFEGAQDDDGYLGTYYGHPGMPHRYTDLEWGHELYCMGHLIQAGVAAIRGGDPHRIGASAVSAADHICREFSAGGRVGGHPEIETALVELSRATGDGRYLRQALRFINDRGKMSLGDTFYGGRDYYQDEVPVRDQQELVGHAVRGLYLIAGILDVGAELGEAELLEVGEAQYRDALARKTYIHGGMGSRHLGESVGDAYELPSDRAYAETCASVASIQVAHRLLLLTGDKFYADIIERTLYNSVLSSPSLDGKSFFYVNTLHRRRFGVEPEEGAPSLRRTDGRRASWFTTSCCPTNVARLLASLGSYIGAKSDAAIALYQYASGRFQGELAGSHVSFAIDTKYPASELVTLVIEEPGAAPWSLHLRVPAWCEGATLTVNGTQVEGWHGGQPLTRSWSRGDTVQLALPMPPRFTYPDARVDHARNSVAVERGPLVYALESVDQEPGLDLDLVRLSTENEPRLVNDAEAPGNLPVVELVGAVMELPPQSWPYGGASHSHSERPIPLTLIPYFTWANREASTMRVWIPKEG